MKRLVLLLLLIVVGSYAQPLHQRLLYHNPLTGDLTHEFASVENHQGKYTTLGWQATRWAANLDENSRLIVRFADRLPASATIEFDLTNFNPA